MPKFTRDSITTITLSFLVLLIAPFLINCLFAFPQTDDFFYSASGRDAGFLQTQYKMYMTWSGRYTSTGLLSINPLAYDSITGYRLVFVIVILAQLASLHLLVDVITKKALSWKENLIFSMTCLFAFLDQMDDIRSGLYWMAGVITYQVADILMILFFSLFILANREQRFDSIATKGAVILLAILIGGTNEISLALTFLVTALLISYRYAIERSVNGFQIVTFLAVTTGSCLGLFAPGNFARIKEYGSNRDLFVIAADAFNASLAYMVVWVTSPLVLILTAMVFFAVIGRQHLRGVFGHISVLYSTSTLLFLTFTSFFIPFWSTGMYPQNRVLNMIYFFFLIGWTINLAVVFARLAEPAQELLKKIDIRRWGFVAAAYVILMFSLQTSNFVLVTSDLLSGASLRYSEEMLQIRSQIMNTANDVCTVEDVSTKPRSLYFCFIGADAKDWVNCDYAAYYRKKSICLTGKKGSAPSP